MKRLIGFILTVIFCAGVVSAQEKSSADVELAQDKAAADAISARGKSSINPASVYPQGYKQDVITVVSPNQAGWSLLESKGVKTVFEKRAADEILNASVRTFAVEIFETDRDLLISLEEAEKEDLSDFKMDSLHFNYVRFKATPCLQYDGIFFFKEAAPKFKYFNVRGYFCAHPVNKKLAVRMEFSNHSNSRGFSENLFSLSDEFFEKTAFPKAAVK
jgi:hypothetical protein